MRARCPPPCPAGSSQRPASQPGYPLPDQRVEYSYNGSNRNQRAVGRQWTVLGLFKMALRHFSKHHLHNRHLPKRHLPNTSFAQTSFAQTSFFQTIKKATFAQQLINT